MANGKKTGGRVKGVPNKKRAEFVETITRNGITPLDYMLQVLRDENAPADRRDEMAKSAAPYIHSKMPTAIVTPPPPSGPVSGDDETLLDQYLNGLHDEADES